MDDITQQAQQDFQQQTPRRTRLLRGFRLAFNIIAVLVVVSLIDLFVQSLVPSEGIVIFWAIVVFPIILILWIMTNSVFRHMLASPQKPALGLLAATSVLIVVGLFVLYGYSFTLRQRIADMTSDLVMKTATEYSACRAWSPVLSWLRGRVNGMFIDDCILAVYQKNNDAPGCFTSMVDPYDRWDCVQSVGFWQNGFQDCNLFFDRLPEGREHPDYPECVSRSLVWAEFQCDDKPPSRADQAVCLNQRLTRLGTKSYSKDKDREDWRVEAASYCTTYPDAVVTTSGRSVCDFCRELPRDDLRETCERDIQNHDLTNYLTISTTGAWSECMAFTDKKQTCEKYCSSIDKTCMEQIISRRAGIPPYGEAHWETREGCELQEQRNYGFSFCGTSGISETKSNHVRCFCE